MLKHNFRSPEPMLIHPLRRSKTPTPPCNARIQAVRVPTARQERSTRSSPDRPDPPQRFPTPDEERGKERGARAAAPHEQPSSRRAAPRAASPGQTAPTPRRAPTGAGTAGTKNGRGGHRGLLGAAAAKLQLARLIIAEISAPLVQPSAA